MYSCPIMCVLLHEMTLDLNNFFPVKILKCFKELDLRIVFCFVNCFDILHYEKKFTKLMSFGIN